MNGIDIGKAVPDCTYPNT